MMTTEKYRMSFTASCLRCRETSVIASLFLRLADWNKVHDEVLQQNILQIRTASSQERIFREMKHCLECLTTEEMQILADNNSSDAGMILWLAVCRCYKFIGEFAREVIHEKYVTFQKSIDDSDYALFFERKCSLHPELMVLKDATRKKIKQILFKLLRECAVIGHDNEILASYFSCEVFRLLSPDDFMYFPTREKGVGR